MPPNRTRAVPRGLQTLFHAGSLVGVTDGPLLERFALRDGEASESAFAALVERHGALVWRTCRAVLRDEHEAADAFQATFLVLVRKAGSLWVRDSIAPWLHRVALRAANQARREARRRKEAEQRAAELNAGWTESAMPDDLADILHQEIDRLPERHRTVVVLCDLEERSYEEAARHLRCPVGTVKSRLARARERLREALSRRGVLRSAVQAASLRDAMAAVGTPPLALTESTIRGSVSFGIDPTQAAGAVSKASVILMEGVLTAMIRAKVQKAILLALAAFVLLVPAWLVHARQAAVGPRRSEAPAAGQKNADRPINLEGNWIVRGYPSGQAFGLIKIEGPRQQPRATLLSVTQPEFTHLAESKIDRLRIDEEAVRFVLVLGPANPNQSRTMEVVAYLRGERAGPDALWGSVEWDGQGQFPAKLERTDRTEIDRKEGQEPAAGVEELHRVIQTKDPAKQREILEEVLEKYADTPTAQSAVMSMAMIRADAGAPVEEVRALIDRAVRYAARYGREMEVGGINRIVRAFVGREDLEGFLLNYARRAVAMLRPSDPVNLQETALKNLALALRKAVKIDETKARAEARALDDRIAALPHGAGRDRTRARPVEPVTRSDNIPWARNFAAARKQARAEGKLIMVDFFTESCGWCKRLDVEVFPSPKVAEALRPFVPVKVDADDGEGRPLLERYRAYITTGPTILFLDPAVDDPKDARIVGKISGFLPPSSFVEQLTTIAGLPRDVGKLMEKVHPEDGDTMRRLATALAMQGRVKEATALIDRAWGPGVDRNFDRWAAVYNTIGDEVMLYHEAGQR